MTVEELPVYAYFQLEDYVWDDVKELPGADEDCICDWDEIARNVVEGHFREACKNLWPILEFRSFKSITIGIDIIGTGQKMAGYYHNYSDAETGNYGFSVSYDVLEEYLKEHFDKKAALRPVTKYMWEHELIHLADHRNLIEFKYHSDSTDVREYFIHYLLKYREEGTADLYFVMKNHGSITDPETAMQKIMDDLKELEKMPWENPDTIKSLEMQLLSLNLFYTAGPWMVLHVLSCPGNPVMTPLAEEAARKIQKCENVEKDVIVRIIQKALLISNEDFIRYLTLPGLDGKVFIEPGPIEQLAYRLGKINHEREIHPEDEEYNIVNKKLTDFYRKMWPDKEIFP
jgi:hypothetical protein